MSLQIIGAGFGRTSTMSLKIALEQLGFGPCYHMSEVAQHPDHDAVWLTATRRQGVDWDALFKGYAAGVDWPIAAFWRELASHYPQAKFILTIRDPEAWYTSIAATIFPALMSEPVGDPTHRTMTRELILEQTFGGRHADKDHVIDTYLQHNQAVRDTLGPQRLLEYETGTGWDPLCAFLGVSAPEQPFPMTNTTEEFQNSSRARRQANEAKRG